MTHHAHHGAAPTAPASNVFIGKIILRLDVAADSLRAVADSFDGRAYMTSDEVNAHFARSRS